MSDIDPEPADTPLFTYLDGHSGTQRELPFVIGVLADLSASGDLSSRPLAEREFVDLDRDTFAELLARICPRLLIVVDHPASILWGGSEIVLEFRTMDDFCPDRLVDQIEPLSRLLALREAVAERITVGDLTGAVALRGDRNAPGSLNNLLGLAAAHLAEIDTQISWEIGQVIRSPEFQRLEAAWRGLQQLVDHVATSERLRIRVLDVSAKLLRRDQLLSAGDGERTGELGRKIYDPTFASAEETPFGVLVGDFEFNGHPDSVQGLSWFAQIAEQAHAPFIASAAPAMFELQGFEDFAACRRDVCNVFGQVEWAAWRSFRESAAARYSALCIPRVLLRGAYGSHERPVRTFAWCDGADDTASCLWGSAAFTLAAKMAAAFNKSGWCAGIAGHENGRVSNLMAHRDALPDGAATSIGPTDYHFWDTLPHDIARKGFIPLIGRPGSHEALFLDMPTCHQPAEFDDPTATADHQLAAQLPYVMATCRVVHYLRAMVHSPAIDSLDSGQIEQCLLAWLRNYDRSFGPAEQDDRRRPLAGASLWFVSSTDDGPWQLRLRINPGYQISPTTIPPVAQLNVERPRQA